MAEKKKQDITETILKKEGIIAANEQFETLYLNEDEIEKFMEKYLRDNPDAEIETRYVSQPPIELTQNIQVKWLRPETPEVPPIIIKEVDPPSPGPTLKIVEKSSRRDDDDRDDKEPLVIRERPPFPIIPEPTIAYVQNVSKKKDRPSQSSTDGKKRAHETSQSSFHHNSSKVFARLLDLDESHHHQHFSFEERDVELESIDEAGFFAAAARGHSTHEDHEHLRFYEEKLKQTLYEEYLLKFEREKLEKKLTKSGLFEERLRERSISHDRLSQMSSSMDLRYRRAYPSSSSQAPTRTIDSSTSNTAVHSSRVATTQQVVNDQLNFERTESILSNNNSAAFVNSSSVTTHNIPVTIEKRAQSLDRPRAVVKGSAALDLNDTSSYRSIKFARVTDEREIRRLNEILSNPNALTLKRKSDADKIAISLAKLAEAEAKPLPAPLPPLPNVENNSRLGLTSPPAQQQSYVKTSSTRENNSRTNLPKSFPSTIIKAHLTNTVNSNVAVHTRVTEVNRNSIKEKQLHIPAMNQRQERATPTLAK